VISCVASTDPGGRLVPVAALAANSVLTGARPTGTGADDAPGGRRLIPAANLPTRYATPSADNPSSRVRRPAGALPKAPLVA
jgi:hypothetical protein